jgi:hypothetical protein
VDVHGVAEYEEGVHVHKSGGHGEWEHVDEGGSVIWVPNKVLHIALPLTMVSHLLHRITTKLP